MQSLLPPSRARAASPCARTPAPCPPAKARSEHRSPLPDPGLRGRQRRPGSPLHPLRSPLQGRERGAVSVHSARGAAAPDPGGPSPPLPALKTPAGCLGAGAARVPSRSLRARGSGTALLSRSLGQRPQTLAVLTSRPDLGASRRTPAAATSSASSGPAPAAVAVAAPAQASEPPPRRTFSGTRLAPLTLPARAASPPPVRGREGARARGRRAGGGHAPPARARGWGRGFRRAEEGAGRRAGFPSNPAPCGPVPGGRGKLAPCGLFPGAGGGRRRCVSTPQVCTPPPGCSARRDYKVKNAKNHPHKSFIIRAWSRSHCPEWYFQISSTQQTVY